MLPRAVQVCRIGTTNFGNNPEALEIRQLSVKDPQFMGILWRFFPFVYRLTDKGAILLQVCRERKWKPMAEFTAREEEYLCHQTWNLWWRTSSLKGRRFPGIHSWQTVNFIPNAGNYCNKDFLVRYLRRMMTAFPSLYDFCPLSFNLPQDYPQMVTEHRKRNGLFSEQLSMDAKSMPKVVWIAKPVGKSQGKGIYVFDRCINLRYDDQYVVQEYVQEPFLIDGFKWDLRIYVCITCNNPLTFYAYEEGIVRFATSKYDLSNLDNSFSHLTNTSINKQSPMYYKHKDTIGYGSKWSLSQLRRYFQNENIRDYAMWQKIWSILVLTILGEAQEIAGHHRCWEDNGFQFLGFDILVDKNLKPYLLEVNLHPGLNSDKCAVDFEVKVPLLHDMFDLLNLPDGRRFPEPAVASASVVESTDQLCARIKEALKDSEPNTTGLFPGLLKTKKKLKDKAPRPKATNVYSAGNLRPPASRLQLKGPKLSIFKASSIHTFNLDRNNNVTSDVSVREKLINSTIPQVDFHSPDMGMKKGDYPWRTPDPPVVLRLPTLKKSSARLQLPTNGPGLTFLPRVWKDAAPKVCGKWVRIFPFDEVTTNCSTFGVHTDPTDCIKRVGVHLQAVRELSTQVDSLGPAPKDSFYDKKLLGQLNTKVWHPYP